MQDIVAPTIYAPVYSKTTPPQGHVDYPPIRAPRRLVDLALEENQWPHTGFLEDYLAWIEPTTDAPRAVHVIAALSLLSVSAGRRWVTPHGGKLPNIWSVIVADSGSRKSTAMDRAVSLADNANRVISTTISSPQMFVEILRAQEDKTECIDEDTLSVPLLWHLDEADGLFQALRQTYAVDFASKLTTAYDGREVGYASLAQKVVRAAAPCLTLLAGSDFTWLRAARFTPEFLQGGLFSRMWIVPARRTTYETCPLPPDEATADELRGFLRQLEGTGPFTLTWSAEARNHFQLYQGWLNDHAPDPLLRNAWNRVPDHVAKAATLFHIAQYRSGVAPIDLPTLQCAINLVHNFILPGHLWVLRRLAAADDKVCQIEQDIQDAILNAPAPPSVRVLESGYGRRQNTHEALLNLYRRQAISFWRIGGGRRGQPQIVVAMGVDAPEIKGLRGPALPKFIQVAEDDDGTLLEEADDGSEIIRV